MRADDPRHGTHAGYKAHRNVGEAACTPCLAANTRYHKRLVYDLMHGRRRMRPVIGAVRRIQALQRLGWSMRVISREAGLSTGDNAETLRYVLRPTTRYVTPAVDDAIRTVYAKLSMRLPAPSSGSTRARRAAERKGFAPPLAWDDIDSPDEQPRGVVQTAHHRKPYSETSGHVEPCPRCGVRRQVNESRSGLACRDCKSVEKVA